MKKRLYIFLSLVAAVVASGCSRAEAVDPDVDGHPIGVDVSVGDAAAAKAPATRYADGSIGAGDQFGMFVVYPDETIAYSNLNWRGAGDPVVWTPYADAAASTATSPLWGNAGGTHKVYAYAPYDASRTALPTATAPWSVDAGTDLIWFKDEAVTPNALTNYQVPITFTHKMSQLTVNLTLQGGIAGSTPTVTIEDTFVGATFDGSTIAVVDSGEGVATASLATVTNGSAYGSIIVPQTAAVKVKVAFEGGPTLSATIPSTTYLAGKSYSVNLTCTATALTVGTVTVGDWAAGDSWTFEPNGGNDNLTE